MKSEQQVNHTLIRRNPFIVFGWARCSCGAASDKFIWTEDLGRWFRQHLRRIKAERKGK